METLQELHAKGLLAMGFGEVESTSRKYRTFRSPKGTLYFLGKSGAVRFGKNASSSISLAESSKAVILAKAK